MILPVVMLGAGGHAKVLLDTLVLQKLSILGVVDFDARQIEKLPWDLKWLGQDECILDFLASEVQLVNGIGSIKTCTLRKQLFANYKEWGYSFMQVIHPSVIMGGDVSLGEGVQVMAAAVIQTGTVVGDNVIINTKVAVDHDCIIGDHTHLAPGVTLSGGVNIGAGVHVGTGATVIQGIKVGDNSIIGAGAVVIEDVPPSVTVVGVPARILDR